MNQPKATKTYMFYVNPNRLQQVKGHSVGHLVSIST